MLECDYDTGLLAPSEDTHGNESPEDLRLLLIHEAAHAVMLYVLGFGLTRIFLVRGDIPQDGDGKPFVLSGAVPAQRGLKFEGVLNEKMIAHGVASAAGPAAERKLRLAMGLPLGMKTYAQGDHAAINKAATALDEAGHDGRAYREEVWRRAQAAMEDPTIWHAVNVLADKLRRYWPTDEQVEAHVAGTSAPCAGRERGRSLRSFAPCRRVERRRQW